MPLAENDQVATIGEGGRRVRLYPDLVVGRFIRARMAVAWGLVLLLLIAPWVDVNGHAGLRFDVPARRFHVVGMTLFATDASWLLFPAGFLILTVFLVTALFGRAWCGWACPQTVFLEGLIRPIEALIEGRPNARRRLDAAPYSASRLFKKGLKYLVYLVVAGAAATTVVAYFLGRDGILEAQAYPMSHPAGTTFFVVLTALLVFDFAWFREQVCVVVCPYGRLQSVLLDADSLTVGYDARRGEPRGLRRTPGTGDCVDCGRCVQVCPTGIDIRKGLQMECVACTACIDACDQVMDRLARPRGLIRYSSSRALAGQAARVLRIRVVMYSVGVAALAVGLAFAVQAREPVEVMLTRPPGQPYAELSDGRVQNPARLRLANKSNEMRSFTVEVLSPQDGKVLGPVNPAIVPPGAVIQLPVFLVRAAPQTLDGRSDFRIRVFDDLGDSQTLSYPFLSRPDPGPPK